MVYLSFVLDLHRCFVEIMDEGPKEEIATHHDLVLNEVLVYNIDDAHIYQQSN